MNIYGVSKLSKERLIDELRKILNIQIIKKISKDKTCLEILETIFPQLKYFDIFSKLNFYSNQILKEIDFVFIISLLIIDETDNADFFLYKYNFSKKDNKRIKNIHEFYKEKTTVKTFTEKNMNKVFYYKGKETVLDILNFRIFKSRKLDVNIVDLLKFYKDKKTPVLPVKANNLKVKYQISEGKMLGDKLKLIEEEWVKNNFQISDQQVENIMNN